MPVRRFASSVALLLLAGAAQADWNPRPTWKDSYAVDGVCYCDSSNFDHNLGSKSAPTPIGQLNVRRICADIRDVLGTGRTDGRVPYNDIQCGNGPANDAADEAGCPGRVDRGSSGCSMIGPRWNLEAVYGPWPADSPSAPTAPAAPASPDEDSGSLPPVAQEPGDAEADVDDSGHAGTEEIRPEAADSSPTETDADVPDTVQTEAAGDGLLQRRLWTVGASHGTETAASALDGNPSTRWTSGTAQRIGQSFSIDFGRREQVSGLRVLVDGYPTDQARRYVLWRSDDAEVWTPLRSGSPTAGTLELRFDPVSARYLRMNQIGHDDFHWWSITEIDVFAGQG